MGAIGTIVGAGAAVGGAAGFGAEAANQQERAAQDAASKTRRAISSAKGEAATTINTARNQLTDARNASVDEIRAARAASASALGQGLEDSLAARQAGLGRIDEATGQARSDITSTGEQAAAALDRTANTQAIGARDVTGQRSRLDELYARGPAPVDLESNPAYQARLEAGSDALSKRFAAMGGRSGGRAMKDLTRFAQDTASEEYARQRAQNLAEFNAQAGVAAGADQSAQSALFNQAGREMQAGLNAQGIRAAGQQGLAALYGQQGMNLANLGMQGGMAGANQYNMAAGDQMATANALAQMYGQAGQNIANTTMGAAGMNLNAAQNLAGLEGNLAQQYAATYGTIVPYAGGGLAAAHNTGMQVLNMGAGVAGNAAGGAAGAASGGFSPSDERVKTDIGRADKEVESFLDVIEESGYEYTFEPGRRRYGVIAQHAERSEVGRDLVIEVDGVKYIREDYGVTLAGLANLHRRLRAVEDAA